MSEISWNHEADIVVVGAGLAGYCAALEAASLNAKVVLVEKLAQDGGTSGMCGGLFAFAGTDIQRRHGIVDSDERLFDDLCRVGGHKNDEKLVRRYVEHQLDTYYWLKANGVLFGETEASAGQSVPRSHTTNSRQVIDALGAVAAKQSNIQIMLDTPAHRLVRSNAQWRVAGLHAKHDGRDLYIRARKGVILSSGGFSRNKRLLETFAPMQVDVNTVCGKGCSGDGLLMAWQLGASLRDMAYLKSTFGNHPNSGSERHLLLFPVYRGAIAVNKQGRRFVNESLSYKLLGDACLQQPDKISYQVFDQTVMDKSAPGVLTFDFEEALENGYLLSAATLRDLAVKIGIDAEVLQATIDRYNNDLDSATGDEFGRNALSSGFGAPVKLKQPPFYAYPSVNVMLGTYCGVGIDENMRVLDVFDDVIPNLFAAGEVHGGFHGVAYMTGSGLGKAAIFGRLAARSVCGRLQ